MTQGGCRETFIAVSCALHLGGVQNIGKLIVLGVPASCQYDHLSPQGRGGGGKIIEVLKRAGT